MSSAPTITTSRRQAWELGLLFGVLYFVVGVTEPTEGIVAQPVRSLMVKAGDSTGTVTLFAALLTLPWCFKPLYGLCSDYALAREKATELIRAKSRDLEVLFA